MNVQADLQLYCLHVCQIYLHFCKKMQHILPLKVQKKRKIQRNLRDLPVLSFNGESSLGVPCK